VDPARWNPEKGRVKGTTEQVRRLNQCVETFEHRAREIYNKCVLAGKIVTAEAIKHELVVTIANQHYLVAEMEKYVSTIEKRIGHDYSAGTVKNWKVTLGHLKDFLQETRSTSDIAFMELDMPLLHAIVLRLFSRKEKYLIKCWQRRLA
jgi:hypothetical protein